MIGLGTAYSATGFKDTIAALRIAYPDAWIGLGTDINGVVGSPRGPCWSGAENPACLAGNPPVVYDQDFPITTMEVDLGGNQILTRSWDYNWEGVAHYGLVPDYIQDMISKGGAAEAQVLDQGAEAFADTWERAEGLMDGIDIDQPGMALGESCDSNVDCESKRCDIGPISAETNTCVPDFGSGQEGDYCTRIQHCQGGLVCRYDPISLGACGP